MITKGDSGVPRGFTNAEMHICMDEFDSSIIPHYNYHCMVKRMNNNFEDWCNTVNFN